MASYDQIQRLVKRVHGFIPKRSWVAHVLELKGDPRHIAHKWRVHNEPQEPCPPDKLRAVANALRHFQMI